MTVEQDDVELDYNAMVQDIVSEQNAIKQEETRLEDTFARQVTVRNDSASKSNLMDSDHSLQVSMENEFPLWAGDASARRSPEGGFGELVSFTEFPIDYFIIKIVVVHLINLCCYEP